MLLPLLLVHTDRHPHAHWHGVPSCWPHATWSFYLRAWSGEEGAHRIKLMGHVVQCENMSPHEVPLMCACCRAAAISPNWVPFGAACLWLELGRCHGWGLGAATHGESWAIGACTGRCMHAAHLFSSGSAARLRAIGSAKCWHQCDENVQGGWAWPKPIHTTSYLHKLLHLVLPVWCAGRQPGVLEGLGYGEATGSRTKSMHLVQVLPVSVLSSLKRQ